MSPVDADLLETVREAYLPESGGGSARECLQAWASEVGHPLERMRAEVHEIVPMGDDQVVVIATWHVEGEDDDSEPGVYVGHLWTFRPGEFVCMDAFSSGDEARAAAEG